MCKTSRDYAFIQDMCKLLNYTCFMTDFLSEFADKVTPVSSRVVAQIGDERDASTRMPATSTPVSRKLFDPQNTPQAQGFQFSATTAKRMHLFRCIIWFTLK